MSESSFGRSVVVHGEKNALNSCQGQAGACSSDLKKESKQEVKQQQ